MPKRFDPRLVLMAAKLKAILDRAEATAISRR
jgi:hypothetical protein